MHLPLLDVTNSEQASEGELGSRVANSDSSQTKFYHPCQKTMVKFSRCVCVRGGGEVIKVCGNGLNILPMILVRDLY